jgi:hypothetical protein
MLDEHFKKLGKLYSLTGHDWILNIHHILTEPTCPTIVVHPEGTNMARYSVYRDSIEESVEAVCDMVYREVVLRERVRSESPITNPDDDHYDKWINARLSGDDAKLPEFPGEVPRGFAAAVDEFLNEHREDILRNMYKGNEYWAAYISATLGYRNFRGVRRLDYEKADTIVTEKLVSFFNQEKSDGL